MCEVSGEGSTESTRSLNGKNMIAGKLERPVEQGGVAGSRIRKFRYGLLTTDVVHRAAASVSL